MTGAAINTSGTAHFFADPRQKGQVCYIEHWRDKTQLFVHAHGAPAGFAIHSRHSIIHTDRLLMSQ